MEDFFKQFRENWEGRPEPSFEEKDWQSLQSRLEAARKKRPLVFGWWWLALPLLALLTASNILIYRELDFAKQEITLLESRRDTMYVDRVVVRTDTVFQTRTLRETVVEYLPMRYAAQVGTGLPSASDQAQLGVSSLVSIEKTEATADGNTPDSQAALVDKTNPEPPVSSLVILERIKSPDLSKLDLPKPSLPEITISPFDFKKKKTLRHHLYAMRPKDFSLSANGGWLRPLGSGVNNGAGYSLGLEGRVGFSPRLALWLGATYGSATVEVVEMEASLGFPAIMPPAGEFSFVGAEAKQRTWQYAAGMQFAPLDRNGWKLWTGVGYGAVQALPYHVTYDFQNAVPLEWKVDGETLRPGLLEGYLLLRLGVERQLKGRFNWQLMADWRTRPGAEGLRPADLLGVKAGIGYRF